MFDNLKYDINAFKRRDPAARSSVEILLLYPGIHALIAYRAAHWFYKHKRFFIARKISQSSRFWTGIEIHPGAKIGRGLVIDHGSGVVIGETTEIGDDCTLYQGVTLGGTGKEHGKRHPTLGNNVLVGSGAKILGPFHVGDNSRIAAGAVVLDEVPENCTAVGVPARVVKRNGVRVHPCDEMDQVHIPDPISSELCKMRHEIECLKKQLDELKGESSDEDL